MRKMRYILVLGLLVGCAGTPDEPVILEGEQISGGEIEVFAQVEGMIEGKYTGEVYFEDVLTVGNQFLPGVPKTLPEAQVEYFIDFRNPELGKFQKGTGILHLAMAVHYVARGDVPPPEEVRITAPVRIRGRMHISHGWFLKDQGTAPIDVELTLGDPAVIEADPDVFHTADLRVPYRPEPTEFFLGLITIRLQAILDIELRFHHVPSKAALEPATPPPPLPSG